MKLRTTHMGATDGPISTISFVCDDDLDNTSKSNLVAVVLYGKSGSGNVIYWHRDGYDAEKVMFYGERLVGESIARYKQYDCAVRKR